MNTRVAKFSSVVPWWLITELAGGIVILLLAFRLLVTKRPGARVQQS
jgi:hypothetical protein